MFQSKHCLHLKPDGVSKLCALNLVRLQFEPPSRLGNFSFIISVVDILKRPTLVSVKSYTLITINTIILKTEISVQFDTMQRIQLAVQLNTQIQSVFITIRFLVSNSRSKFLLFLLFNLLKKKIETLNLNSILSIEL